MKQQIETTKLEDEQALVYLRQHLLGKLQKMHCQQIVAVNIAASASSLQ